ncbi:MAG: arsenic transporter [Myxococcales bacterium]|nr:arsenic transporter [Myxococcales bacterium]
MVGASLLVAVGTFAGPYGLQTEEAFHSIEPNTLALLLGMMTLSATLGEAGFFALAGRWLGRSIETPAGLLWAVTLGCGLLSALLVNDAVCLLATPLVVEVARRRGARLRPLLFAVAMGSNVGSAMTLAGNPQNMLVARLSSLSYRGYLVEVAFPVGASLLVTAAMLHWLMRRELVFEAPEAEASQLEAPVAPRLLAGALVALLVVVAGNLGGASLAWSAMLGASLALVVAGARAESILLRVEGSVLLFFAGLFVVVAALRKTGLPSEWLAALGPTQGVEGLKLLVPTLTLGSQIVSNVPLILLLEPWIRTFPDATLAWTMTAVVSTLAGNLTPLGSVANIIVLEQARQKMGIVEYLKVGVPVTLVSTMTAVALLLFRR